MDMCGSAKWGRKGEGSSKKQSKLRLRLIQETTSPGALIMRVCIVALLIIVTASQWLAKRNAAFADEASESKRADALVEKYVAAGGDAASRRKLLDDLRLAGAAGMEALGRALDRNEAAQASAEGKAINLLLFNVWTLTEMVPRKADTNWRTIYPERCFGGRRIVPPSGTSFMTRHIEEKERKDHLAGVAEEYCEKMSADNRTVRHGPYTLRGPNGEALEQGEYVDGRREGKWFTLSGAQFCERTYRDGKPDHDKTKVIGNADRWIAIDFGAANPQKTTIVYCGLGSTRFSLGSVSEKDCLLTVGGEIERGEKPVVIYRVPRTLGRRTFDNTTMGLDFSSLKEYTVNGK
jgi:hypothetical protein